MSVAMTAPTFDSLRRAFEVLQGPQGRVIESLAEGRQPSPYELDAEPSVVEDAVEALVRLGIVYRPDVIVATAGTIALTDKGLRVAELSRELAIGAPDLMSATQPTHQ
jgi:hypothetical protein